MSSVAGAADLLRRLILKRDRVLLAVWIYFFLVVPVSFAYSLAKLYPTAADRARFAATSQANTVFTSLYGRLYGSSLGDLVAWRSGFMLVLAGLFGILAVTRNTRVEEESGRWELLRSAAVGRHAGLAAALAESAIASTAVLVLSTLGLIIVKHLPLSGTLTLGAEFAAVGLMFAAIAAVTAQLTSSASTARGLAIFVLAAAYLLRMVGDAGPRSLSWLAWVSPISWAGQMRAYAGDRWWLLGVVTAFVVVMTALAALAAGPGLAAAPWPACDLDRGLRGGRCAVRHAGQVRGQPARQQPRRLVGEMRVVNADHRGDLVGQFLDELPHPADHR